MSDDVMIGRLRGWWAVYCCS